MVAARQSPASLLQGLSAMLGAGRPAPSLSERLGRPPNNGAELGWTKAAFLEHDPIR